MNDEIERLRQRFIKQGAVAMFPESQLTEADRIAASIKGYNQRDMVQRFVVPVTSEKKLSDCHQAKRLIDFYRYTGHVIVEVD